MYMTFIEYFIYIYKYYFIKYLWQTQDCEKIIKPIDLIIINIFSKCTMKIKEKNTGDG